MTPDDAIFVAGHRGLVGSALVRALEAQGHRRVLVRGRAEVDLTSAEATAGFFEAHRPRYVVLAAAKVGGIHANNQYPADFIRDNLLIQNNVIEACHRTGVDKLLFLGSSCIYPKLAEQPIKESYLLSGALEPTNKAYAVAKIAGMVMCESYNRQYGTNFISAMPTNLYGPNDNFDLENSHVLPAMIRKFHEAKTEKARAVTLWGSGTPRREFLHVDDLARACLFLLQNFDATGTEDFVNVGVGEDVSIRELAELVRETVGFTGDIEWDQSKPDGTPRKLLDVGKMTKLGWKAKIPLPQGVRDTYEWYCAQVDGARR